MDLTDDEHLATKFIHPFFLLLLVRVRQSGYSVIATVELRKVFGKKTMLQACGPSASAISSLESSSSGFPFSNQGDVLQSSVLKIMEIQYILNPPDLALSHATNGQYAFPDGTPNANLQEMNFWQDHLQSVFHIDNGQLGMPLLSLMTISVVSLNPETPSFDKIVIHFVLEFKLTVIGL